MKPPTPRAHLATFAAAAAAAALALAPGSASAASLPAGSTALLSGTPSLLEALPSPVGRADINPDSVSSDGRYVAFSSTSDGLLDGDDDRFRNIYRKDTETGAVVLVSRRDGANGEPSHGPCLGPTISDDGNRVAFTCRDALDPAADANAVNDVYVRDLTTNATILASRKSALGDAGNDASGDPALSADGTFVAFSSYASNLVSPAPSSIGVYRRQIGGANETILVSRTTAGLPAYGAVPSISDSGSRIAFSSADALDAAADANGAGDVYVRDVPASATILVSRAGPGNGAVGNKGSDEPAIAGNGSAVAFESRATNLAPAFDSADDVNVYRRSLQFQVTDLVDATSGNVKSGSGTKPSIDESGANVAFVSTATGLDPADTSPSRDTYVKNLLSNAVRLTSRASGDGPAANAGADVAAISGDAKKVASELETGRVVPGAEPRQQTTVIRTLATKTTQWVGRPAGDAPFVNAGAESQVSVLSADGRYAAFETESAGLGLPASASNGIVVRDRITGDVTLVSRADGPTGEVFPEAYDPAISADGRRVAFSAPTVADGPGDVYVRDLASGRTFLADRVNGEPGVPGNGSSYFPSLDADGSRVAFTSSSSNLGDGDQDNLEDVHVRDLDTGATILVSRADGPAGAKGDGNSSRADIDASGTKVSFASDATNLKDGDTDDRTDIHLRDLGAGTTRLISATPGGTKADQATSQDHSIDASGQRVAFATASTNLGDAEMGQKVFVRDLVAGTLASQGRGFHPVLSPDGGHLAFTTTDADTLQVYRRDIAAGQTELVSRRGGDGAAATLDTFVGDISNGGACVSFDTFDALVGPRRDPSDVYVRAFAADCGDPAAPPAEGGDDGGNGGPVVAGGDGVAPRDTVAPLLSRVRLTRRRFRAARGSLLRFRTSEAGTLSVVAHRLRARRKPLRLGALARRVAAGDGRVRLRNRIGRRALRPGRYRLTVTVRDAAGNRSRAVRVRFAVLAAVRRSS